MIAMDNRAPAEINAHCSESIPFGNRKAASQPLYENVCTKLQSDPVALSQWNVRVAETRKKRRLNAATLVADTVQLC
jgi:hypothetical protein